MVDKITRREKLLAKVCWPWIDTQRTRFLLVNNASGFIDIPDYGKVKAVYGAPPNFLPIPIERIELRQWAARGRRYNVLARWGYSAKLDTVVIRDVRMEHHTDRTVIPVLKRMFGEKAG